jgi:vitamin B12 transporter
VLFVVALATPALLAGQVADTTWLPDLVSTATRLPAADGGDVASHEVLTREEMQQRSLRFVLDGLRDQPAASMVQPGPLGSQASLFLRGGNSDYVKVLVDGIPMNQPGGLFNFANLTTDNVERVEVLRGPASVLYGSDAMTGVVQLFTQRGAGRPKLALSGLGGTFGTSEFGFDVSGGTRTLGFSGSVGNVASNGIYAFNNAYRNFVGSGRLDIAASAGTRIGLTARYADGRYEFPTDFTGVPVDSNSFNTERTVTLGADVTQRISSTIEGRVLLADNQIQAGLDDLPDGVADTVGYGFSTSQQSDIARRSVDARLVVRPSAIVSLTGGAAYEYESERLSASATSNFGGGSFVDENRFDESRGTVAVFAQGVANLASGLTATAGIRFDDNSAFGEFTTWRAGAAWRLGSGTRFRGSVGTGYKAPRFREMFIDVPFEVGNPDLKPERSTTWELGVEQALLRDRLQLGVTWFSSTFRDLIQYSLVDFGNPDVPTYYNLGSADASGIEVGATYQVLDALAISGQYTWLSTDVVDAGASLSPVFQDGEPLLRRPAHTARLRVAGRPFARLGLGANVNFVGARADVDFNLDPVARVTLASYTLFELTGDVIVLEAAPSRPGLTALLRIENLFDAQYLAAVGFPGRGRMILAGARLTY